MQHHPELQTSLLEADSEKDNAVSEPAEVCFNTYACTFIHIQHTSLVLVTYNIESLSVYIERNKT